MPARPEPSDLQVLYERCAPMAHRRARQMLRDDDEAWDVVHDVFAKVATRGMSLHSARPMTYFYRAVTHACINHIQASAARAKGTPLRTISDGDGGTGAMIARNLLLRLAPSLDDLDREILVLHYLDDLSQEEVAEVTGKWRRTVGRRLLRIRALAEGLSEPVRAEEQL